MDKTPGQESDPEIGKRDLDVELLFKVLLLERKERMVEKTSSKNDSHVNEWRNQVYTGNVFIDGWDWKLFSFSPKVDVDCLSSTFGTVRAPWVPMILKSST